MKIITLEQFLVAWPGAEINLILRQTSFSIVDGQKELVAANYKVLGSRVNFGPKQGGYASVLACVVNKLDHEGYNVGQIDRFNVPI